MLRYFRHSPQSYKKSPLKDKPLRNPGQSLDEAIRLLMDEDVSASKPIKGKATIYFDGETIKVNGRNPHRNPITQAQAQATWLREQITTSTGQTHPIKPVIVFPGWYVVTAPQAKDSNLWVINPKGLPKFLDHEHTQLSPESIKLVAYHLSRYIRTHQ